MDSKNLVYFQLLLAYSEQKRTHLEKNSRTTKIQFQVKANKTHYLDLNEAHDKTLHICKGKTSRADKSTNTIKTEIFSENELIHSHATYKLIQKRNQPAGGGGEMKSKFWNRIE